MVNSNMICELCGGAFEGMGFRSETDPKESTFERIVDYKKCNLCGSGMVIFHPYMPKTPTSITA